MLRQTPKMESRALRQAAQNGQNTEEPKTPLPPGVNDVPGNPNRPATFLSVEHDEQKLAAYLGFHHTSHLRKLALTWPVTQAFLKFDRLNLHTDDAKEGTFYVLRDFENTRGFLWRIYSVNPSLEWPIRKEDRALEDRASRAKDLSREEFRRQATRKLHRYARIAHILLHMGADFVTYGRNDAINNWTENEFHKLALQNHLGVDIRYTSTLSGPPIRPGIFELRADEDHLEKCNKFYNLLRYLQLSAEKCKESDSLWSKRFQTSDAVMDGQAVELEHVPKWMRPAPQVRPIVLPPVVA
ncbi:uncharacterized protein N7498_010928 [Penicillium cinerascens]|uniref:Uncharacterized protein n=1 Tax=Penicillium cinerascens TaxID=70096 RepID=A0A9W9J8A9_9EURO|nr:uncharacterized protein N7498_010928 [Penicillium cinerascens]KAJ5191943.1 hypothetical protein N7498_010928 [Penicillium cinerascens]